MYDRVFNKTKRKELKNWIRETSLLIRKMKDSRKMDHNRKYPNWKQPDKIKLPNGKIFDLKDSWYPLERISYHFRHFHISASMMRGKTIDQIETLPKCPMKLKEREKPDMNYVEEILEEYEIHDEYEDVCISLEQTEQESTSSTSGSRSSGISSEEPLESMEKSDASLFKSIRERVASLF